MSTLKNIIKELYDEVNSVPSQQMTMRKTQSSQTRTGLYDAEMEKLIDLAIIDGTLTEKEKQILFKKAQAKGIDLDEFEMVLDARLSEYNHIHNKKSAPSNLSAPKSEKFGDVRRCPQCNALVKAFSPVCTACGYEFLNIDASMSYEKLSNKLSEVEDIKKRINIIETFPIPNAKADLLDFLTSAKPHITDSSDPCRMAYWKKYQECINKAELSFKNDDIFKPFIDDYTRFKRKVIGVGFLAWFKRLHWAWKVTIIILLICLISSGIEALISLFNQPSI